MIITNSRISIRFFREYKFCTRVCKAIYFHSISSTIIDLISFLLADANSVFDAVLEETLALSKRMLYTNSGFNEDFENMVKTTTTTVRTVRSAQT